MIAPRRRLSISVNLDDGQLGRMRESFKWEISTTYFTLATVLQVSQGISCVVFHFALGSVFEVFFLHFLGLCPWRIGCLSGSPGRGGTAGSKTHARSIDFNWRTFVWSEDEKRRRSGCGCIVPNAAGHHPPQAGDFVAPWAQVLLTPLLSKGITSLKKLSSIILLNNQSQFYQLEQIK